MRRISFRRGDIDEIRTSDKGEALVVFREDSNNYKSIAKVVDEQCKVDRSDIALLEVTARLSDRRRRDSGDDNDYYIITLSGGLNGNGDWKAYLEDIVALVRALEDAFVSECWLVGLDNDYSDDVFYIEIGMKER